LTKLRNDDLPSVTAADLVITMSY